MSIHACSSQTLDFSLLASTEQQLILEDWNATQKDYPHNLCIHQLVELQAEHTPTKIAVRFENQQLTYEELNQQANQLAHYLQASGVNAETLVGICLERSLNLVVTLLGVLKAGGAYVPLDPVYPPERLALMIEDSQLSLLISQSALGDKLPQHQATIVWLDCDRSAIAQFPCTNLLNNTTSANLAYTIYTSGSTGKPKGVQICHQAVVNFLYSMREAPGLVADDVFLAVTTICFDIAALEIFLPLMVGAQVALASRELATNANQLSTAISELGITVMQATPATWRLLLANGWQGNAQLKILCGGEAMTPDLAQKLLERCGALWNMYGPTETTIWSAIQHITCIEEATLIGRPIANTQIYLLKSPARRREDPICLVPVGTPGEVYIGGDGVARGYLNRPELNTERFIPDPFSARADAKLYKTGDLARYRTDGTIEFIGRVDHQVKIRGFRIELGDIEATLCQHPQIKQAAVVAKDDHHGDKRLIAYLTLHNYAEATSGSAKEQNLPQSLIISHLRAFVQQKLPDYMVPAIFMVMGTLPLTPNGKIDRRTLPEPDRSRPFLQSAFVPPSSLLEQQLAKIWAQLLGVEPIGIHDNFFELGGNSLLVAQLVSQIRQHFQVEMPLDRLFQQPTIASLTQTLVATSPASSSCCSPEINLQAEARLAPDISPKEPFILGAPSNPTILLTGATGFLGAFLLHELLQRTQSDVYCLVRASNSEAGRHKILSNLERYSLKSDSYNTRIFIVPGNLEQPQLGLNAEAFQELANRVDVIYHNGAAVNLIYPYAALQAANVSGTQEVLRLATCGNVKPVHYISTLDVFQSPVYADQSIIWEDDCLESCAGLESGYAQSKWVAEKLIMTARERGIPTCIYRPGMIVGHSTTGASRTDDLVCRIIKGLIQMGQAPMLNLEMSLTPVDYVSQAIVHLSQQPDSLGKPFHLVTPHTLKWADLLAYIAKAGYPLKRLDYRQWQSALSHAATDPANALHPFIDLLSKDLDGEQQMKAFSLISQPFDAQNTLRGLATTDISCSPITTQVLQAYFRYFIHSDFLPASTLA